MSAIGQPRVHKVTVLIEGEDGQSVRFIYYDTYPGQPHDEVSGIELQVNTDARRPPEEFGWPRRISPMRYTHELRVEQSPYYTMEVVVPPADGSAAAELAVAAEEVTPARRFLTEVGSTIPRKAL